MGALARDAERYRKKYSPNSSVEPFWSSVVWFSYQVIVNLVWANLITSTRRRYLVLRGLIMQLGKIWYLCLLAYSLHFRAAFWTCNFIMLSTARHAVVAYKTSWTGAPKHRGSWSAHSRSHSSPHKETEDNYHTYNYRKRIRKRYNKANRESYP